MCYFTICSDTNTKEGHTRALLILDAENHEKAIQEWIKTFNIMEYQVHKGIFIPEGFERLLTDHSKKYILNAKVEKKDVPIISYANRITLKHPNEEQTE